VAILGNYNVLNVVGVSFESTVGASVFVDVFISTSKVPHDNSLVTGGREDQVTSGASGSNGSNETFVAFEDSS